MNSVLTVIVVFTVKDDYKFGHDHVDACEDLEKIWTWGSIIITQQMFCGVLQEAAIFEVIFDDYVGNGIENKLNISGIGCTREMCINFFGILHGIKFFEFDLDVGCGFFISIGTRIFGKADVKRRLSNLFRKQVLLVEE